MKPIRAFVAVAIRATPALRKVILELNGMGRAVKSVDADALHVTLKFLGDTQPEAIPQIAEVVRSSTANREPFEATLKGIGTFPHVDRPSVIWTGLEDSQTLIEIAESLEQGLEPLGFPRESRRFHPHVTLARVKARPPDSLPSLVGQHAATIFGKTGIESVELLQSDLGSHGPKYTVLASAHLK